MKWLYTIFICCHCCHIDKCTRPMTFFTDKLRMSNHFFAAKKKLPVGLTLEQKSEIIVSLDNKTLSQTDLAAKFNVTPNAVRKIYNRQRQSVFEAVQISGFRTLSKRIRKTKLDVLGSNLYKWFSRQKASEMTQFVLLEKSRKLAAELGHSEEEISRINLGWIHRWKKSHQIFKSSSNSGNDSKQSIPSTSQSSSEHPGKDKSRIDSAGFVETRERVRKSNVALTLFQKYAIITALDNQKSNQAEVAKEYGVTCNTVSKIYNHQREAVLAAIKTGEFHTTAKRLRTTKLDAVGTKLLDWFWSSNLAAVSEPILIERAVQIARELGIQDVSGVNKSWIGRWKKSHGISQTKTSLKGMTESSE